MNKEIIKLSLNFI